MATAALDSTHDVTDLRTILRSALVLGLIESALVLAVSVVNRSLEGTVDRAISAVIVAIGLAIVLFWPGRVTRARTIDGIAAAAGIGLAATVVYLVVDVTLLQWIGTYTNRWREIGGGSNWWYHPVWWMVGTFLPWMGAWVLANQARRQGDHAVPAACILVAVLTAVVGAACAALGFPGAGWNVPTFAVAALPASALAVIVSGLGGSRR